MSNRKHKSSQDFKNLRIENAIRKLGGKEQADKIVAEWKTVGEKQWQVRDHQRYYLQFKDSVPDERGKLMDLSEVLL